MVRDGIATSLGRFALALALVVGGSASAGAQKLSDLLPPLIAGHDLVKAAQSDLSAARDRHREALGGWYPTLAVTGHYGEEKYDKPLGTQNTNGVNRVLDLTVTQLLWDFGGTNANIRLADLSRQIAESNLEAARQTLILRAATAYINVKRAADVLKYARDSEDNIKRQTELEDALVKRGAGLSTDVLQAKQQLAGAQARRVQAEGLLLVAKNAYRAVFHTPTPDPGNLTEPQLPLDQLPASLKDAVAIALKENPALTAANSTADASRETVRATRGALSPRVEAVGQAKQQIDEGGVTGGEEIFGAKVQVTWPFNLGLTAVNTLNAASSDAVATALRASEQQHLIEQQVRDSWDNLRISQENAEFLRNQANIASEFLELARRERQAGNRSLLDLLVAETTLINANSDARSAEADVGLWSFTLLNAMGRLTVDKVVD